jgi:ATPase subunit of ABC transporter with duplicated ATPase domains
MTSLVVAPGPVVEEDIDAYIFEVLTTAFAMEEDTAVVMSSYLSGIVDDAAQDPLEAMEAIKTLVVETLPEPSEIVLKSVKQFSNNLVSRTVEAEARKRDEAARAKGKRGYYNTAHGNHALGAKTLQNDPLKDPTKNKFGNEFIVETAVKSKRSSRRRAARRKAKAKDTQRTDGVDLDDWGSSWERAKNEKGGRWGGRSRSGRGVQSYNLHSAVDDIILEGVNLLYDGETLLERTRLQIVKGKCYGLVGRNGCGKSTLLRKMANQSIPGIPLSVKCVLLEQELPRVSQTISAVEFVVAAAKLYGEDPSELRQQLLAERERLERSESETAVGDLYRIEEQLEALGVSDEAGPLADGENWKLGKRKHSAKSLLLELGFSDALIETCPVSQLSGGYRMRLSMACALFSSPDILLLDEPTNHMDLEGVVWLQNFIQKSMTKGGRGGRFASINLKSVVVVSHDATFLNQVTTDIILFYDKRLRYFVGNYSDYIRIRDEHNSHKLSLLEAKEKKEEEAKALAAKQVQAAKRKGKRGHGVDPNKQRQAKEKLKKVERAGFYRNDGKRYKTKSLKDMFTAMIPQVVSQDDLIKEKTLRFRFPSTNLAELRLPSSDSNILSFDNVAYKYPSSKQCTLKNVTIQVHANTRAAIVGLNGAGKTTLIGLVSKQLKCEHGNYGSTADNTIRNRNLKVSVVSQHHTERLTDFFNNSACKYLCHHFPTLSNTKARSHLGHFGICGNLALQPIQTLSGGQKARLTLAFATFKKPHILILDEPTNHLDMESIDALALGINSFNGAVLTVSHNQTFLKETCKELWCVENRTVRVVQSTNGTKSEFAPILESYVRTEM